MSLDSNCNKIEVNCHDQEIRNNMQVTCHKPLATVWLGPQPVILINCLKMARLILFNKLSVVVKCNL